MGRDWVGLGEAIRVVGFNEVQVGDRVAVHPPNYVLASAWATVLSVGRDFLDMEFDGERVRLGHRPVLRLSGAGR